MCFWERQLHALALVLCLGALTACGMAKPMPPFDSFAHRISDGTVALY
jgi:predicted small lipoprotein YifL